MTSLDITKIATRAQAMRALKKLGFETLPFTMVRGTKMLKGHDMTLTLAPENFIATDSQGHFGLIPTCMRIGNTAENATAQYRMIMDLLAEVGLCGAQDTLPILGLAVGIAHLAKLRTEGKIVTFTHLDPLEA